MLRPYTVAISEHLAARRGGRVEQARHYLDLISRQWDDALVRLRAFVEEVDDER